MCFLSYNLLIYRLNAINTQTLQDMKHSSEVVNVISDITTKFEQFNNTLCKCLE